MTVYTVQEGHQAIADAVVEKRSKARGPGCPQGTMKTNWTSTAEYNFKECMQGLEEDAYDVEVRNGEVSTH